MSKKTVKVTIEVEVYPRPNETDEAVAKRILSLVEFGSIQDAFGDAKIDVKRFVVKTK